MAPAVEPPATDTRGPKHHDTLHLVTRANFLVFGVLVVILALVGAVTWERLNASREAREWSQHSYRVPPRRRISPSLYGMPSGASAATC